MLLIMMVLALQTQTTFCNQFGTQTTCTTTAPPALQPLPPVTFDSNGGSREAMRSAMEASERARERSAQQEREIGYIPGCATRFWILAECSRRQHDEAVAGLARRDALAVLRTDVTQKLAGDDCPGAIRAALEGGDMDLAREARDFCRP